MPSILDSFSDYRGTLDTLFYVEQKASTVSAKILSISQKTHNYDDVISQFLELNRLFYALNLFHKRSDLKHYTSAKKYVSRCDDTFSKQLILEHFDSNDPYSALSMSIDFLINMAASSKAKKSFCAFLDVAHPTQISMGPSLSIQYTPIVSKLLYNAFQVYRPVISMEAIYLNHAQITPTQLDEKVFSVRGIYKDSLIATLPPLHTIFPREIVCLINDYAMPSHAYISTVDASMIKASCESRYNTMLDHRLAGHSKKYVSQQQKFTQNLLQQTPNRKKIMQFLLFFIGYIFPVCITLFFIIGMLSASVVMFNLGFISLIAHAFINIFDYKKYVSPFYNMYFTKILCPVMHHAPLERSEDIVLVVTTSDNVVFSQEKESGNECTVMYR